MLLVSTCTIPGRKTRSNRPNNSISPSGSQMTDLVNAWPQIRAALSPNPALQGLVDSCLATYNGVYTLSAPSDSFPALAASYPDLAQQVFTITQQPLRVQLLEQHTLDASSLNADDQVRPAFTYKPKAAALISPDLEHISDNLTLSSGASTVTDAILQPESIAAVPSYLLRFIPYVGADAVLVAIALRQAFYRFGKARGPEQSSPKAGDKVSLEVERILAMLGGALSRATYFRLLKSGDLAWFVTNLGSGHQVVKGQVQRLPNEYQYRGALLTPGDASDLAECLLASGLQENPAKALAAMLATPRNQILKFPYRVPAGERFTEALSVADLLRQLLPNTRLNPELLALCDALSTALIRPDSFLAVPWYWFRKVLPAMGTDLGGLYLMARACGYTDWASGKDRDRFWVQGGEATLQAWVRSKSLPRLIPAEKVSSAGRPRKNAVRDQSDYVRAWRERSRELARGYLLRSATRASKMDPIHTDWQLCVGPTALTSEDQTLRDALYAFLCAADQASPSLPEALRALRQSPALQNALLAAARYQHDGSLLALLSKGVRKTGGMEDLSHHCEERQQRSNLSAIFTSCHSERREESTRSESAGGARFTRTAPTAGLFSGESLARHCEERQQRSNLSATSRSCHSDRSEESPQCELAGGPHSIRSAPSLALLSRGVLETVGVDSPARHCEERQQRSNLDLAMEGSGEPQTTTSTALFSKGARETKGMSGSSLICHFDTLVQTGICNSETLDEAGICHFETLRQAINCYFETLVAAEICDFETVIQILLKLKNSAFFSQDNSNTEDPQQLQPAFDLESADQNAEVVENYSNNEDFAQLFQKIDPRKATEIQEKGLQKQFVAWVIYGALNEKIHDPLNLAVAKTLLSAQVPNPTCLELASLGEATLLAELETYQTQQNRGYLGGDKWLKANPKAHPMKLNADEARKLSVLLKTLENDPTPKE
jgi:hypothetical protein